MADEEMVTITKKEYERLVNDSDWLSCLKAAGVDNWDGWSFAKQLWRDDHPDEDDD